MLFAAAGKVYALKQMSKAHIIDNKLVAHVHREKNVSDWQGVCDWQGRGALGALRLALEVCHSAGMVCPSGGGGFQFNTFCSRPGRGGLFI